MSNKIKICLTGATGFIGSNLLKRLKLDESVEIVALSRKISPAMNNAKKGNVIWRRCNGFSISDVVEATKDVDIIIYLIHSMMPSSTLSQGTFSNFDLLLADNFSRAAKKNNIDKIIYLSGIIPKTKDLSDHLKSRLEVENILSQNNNKLITLRSGLIIGKNGSSFKILERLIKRLPILICPSWAKKKTQPIDLQDVLFTIEYCLKTDLDQGSYDIGGNDIMTYKKMLKQTAIVLNKKRIIVNFPYITPGLSKLWISKITSSSKSLVYPLVESLKHEMLVDPKKRIPNFSHQYIPFKTTLKNGITQEDESWVNEMINYSYKINLRFLENVTSIQRIANPHKISANDCSNVYFTWLHKFFSPFIKVSRKLDMIEFQFLSKKIVLLSLEYSPLESNDTMSLFHIKGGILARNKSLLGRMEFREIPSEKCFLISLLDFRPYLPWFIYKYTQAILHLFVMNRFGKYMRSKHVP